METDHVNVALESLKTTRKLIHAAYGDSLNTNQMLSILLRDVLTDMGKIQSRLEEIQSLT